MGECEHDGRVLYRTVQDVTAARPRQPLILLHLQDLSLCHLPLAHVTTSTLSARFLFSASLSDTSASRQSLAVFLSLLIRRPDQQPFA